MPEPEPQPKPKSTREPQALTSEYHKARKQLMLWSGILFIWELVGIDLQKAKEVGGNAGAIITAIKSPQAVPWVLLILVAYFLFKTTVEWHQCTPSRRALRVSRVDFFSAWFISLLAYALYAYQTIKRVQFADTFLSTGGSQELYVFVLILTFPLIAIFGGECRKLRKQEHVNRRNFVSGIVGIAIFAIAMELNWIGRLNLKVSSVLLALCFMALGWVLLRRAPKQSTPQAMSNT